MTTFDLAEVPAAQWELQYPALDPGHMARVFPCDERGTVSLDELDRRALCDYLFARCMVGRVFAWPRVISVPSTPNDLKRNDRLPMAYSSA